MTKLIRQDTCRRKGAGTCRIKGRNFRKTHGERAINAAMDGRDPLPIIAAIVQILRAGG